MHADITTSSISHFVPVVNLVVFDGLGVGQGCGRAGHLADAGPNLGLAVANELARSALSLVATVVRLEASLGCSGLEWAAAGSGDFLLVWPDELHFCVQSPAAGNVSNGREALHFY